MRGAAGLRGYARRRAADTIHWASEHLQRAGAIGPDCARGRRFRAFGEGSCITFPPAAIYGEAHIEIGSGVMIGANATLSVGFGPDQDFGDRRIVRIGDRAVIGRGSHVVAHADIDIGDDVFTGPYVYITDQNHTYRDPDLPIGRQWPTEKAVRIGSGTWIGTGAVVLPGADIGVNVVVAAGSIVRGVIPDHSVIAGAPARIVRRFDEQDGWQPPLRSGDDAQISEAERIRLSELFDVRIDPAGRF